jgi:hypothetical protein
MKPLFFYDTDPLPIPLSTSGVEFVVLLQFWLVCKAVPGAPRNHRGTPGEPPRAPRGRRGSSSDRPGRPTQQPLITDLVRTPKPSFNCGKTPGYWTCMCILPVKLTWCGDAWQNACVFKGKLTLETSYNYIVSLGSKFYMASSGSLLCQQDRPIKVH